MKARPHQEGPREDRLLEVAGSILEGEPIDWESWPLFPGSETPPRLREQLRLLESLAEFNRVTQRSGPDDWGEPDPVRWGHLEIIEKIGSGSFAEVYHAWDPTLDRDVALKLLKIRKPVGQPETNPVLPPDSSRSISAQHVLSQTGERTIHEARLLAKVRHPNVVTVYGADAQGGRIGLWMELIRGETLSSLVRKRGPLGASEVEAIGHDLLSALAAVHAAGVLHGDLKAQNVMRAEGGRIVLMDFGIGQDLAGRRDGGGHAVFGTALYAAPERLRGEEASVRSELYSLGVLLYYLVTAGFPVEAESLHELTAKHEREERIYLRDRRPDLPHGLVGVIERALSARPEDRPRSAGEMDRGLTGAMPPNGPTGAAKPARPATGRLRHLAWLLPAVVGSIALWLGLAGRYSVEATMYHSTVPGDFALSEHDVVAVDDQVFLKVRGTKDLYVYVVNRDLAGHMTLLFPDPRLELKNPLPGRQVHRLPGLQDGQNQDWKIASGGGKEQFLIIANLRRLTVLEANIKDLDRVGRQIVSPEALRRGVKEFAPARSRRSSPGVDATEEIFLQARPLTHGRESVKGSWIRKLDLTGELK